MTGCKCSPLCMFASECSRHERLMGLARADASSLKLACGVMHRTACPSSTVSTLPASKDTRDGRRAHGSCAWGSTRAAAGTPVRWWRSATSRRGSLPHRVERAPQAMKLALRLAPSNTSGRVHVCCLYAGRNTIVIIIIIRKSVCTASMSDDACMSARKLQSKGREARCVPRR